MKKIIILTIFVSLTLSACNSNTLNNLNPLSEPQYDSESWKTIIPEDCQYFSDGCNGCNRIEGQTGASCTRMGCEKYKKPECLDNKMDNDQK